MKVYLQCWYFGCMTVNFEIDGVIATSNYNCKYLYFLYYLYTGALSS